uniref:Uncharacterized protein n=1 Tax=Anguilla anguilla TaxID=7936 RepID=A0A0E9VVR6_ANGAN
MFRDSYSSVLVLSGSLGTGLNGNHSWNVCCNC